MKAKTLYDSYISARDALLDHAAEEFRKLAEDKDLVEALAWIHQSSPEYVRKALTNPQAKSIERRFNGVGEVVGIDCVIRSDVKSRSRFRTRSTDIPLELLICEEGPFQKWRDKIILRFTEESQRHANGLVSEAKRSLDRYRRLPEAFRKANPLPKLK